MVAVYIILGFLLLLILFFASGKPVASYEPAESDSDIKKMALSGLKVAAIKEYIKLHHVSLTEAKEAVEKMIQDEPLPEVTEEKLREIQRLINRKQKIAAVREYRALYGVGLKDAKDAVDLMEKEYMQKN